MILGFVFVLFFIGKGKEKIRNVSSIHPKIFWVDTIKERSFLTNFYTKFNVFLDKDR